MWSDARNLWKSARSLGTGIITQITETLDSEEFNGHDEASPSQIRSELETYKQLLNEAQMQHVEISKQSRLLLAEKDSQLALYKTNLHESSDRPIVLDNSAANLSKLEAEKLILEESLRNVEQLLKESLLESTDARVKCSRLAKLEPQYDQLFRDFTDQQTRIEASEKQKNDTIENLVAEYSQLAAETELKSIEGKEYYPLPMISTHLHSKNLKQMIREWQKLPRKMKF